MCKKQAPEPFSFEQSYENFTYSPANPQPGQTITVHYKPELNKLKRIEYINPYYGDMFLVFRPHFPRVKTVKNVTMLVYNFSDDTKYGEVKEFPLIHSDGVWTGSFVHKESHPLLLFNFQVNDYIDNNSYNGYQIISKDSNGKISPQIISTFCNVDRWGYSVGLDKNDQEIIKILEQGIALFSNLRSRFTHCLWSYKYRSYPLRYEKGRKEVAKEIKRLASKKRKTIDDKILLYQGYSRLQKEHLSERYKLEILAENPNHLIAEHECAKELGREHDLERMLDLYVKFINRFPDAFWIPGYTNNATRKLLDSKKFTEVKYFLKNIIPNPQPHYYYAVCDHLLKDSSNYDIIFDFAQQGIDLTQKELGSPNPWRKVQFTVTQKKITLKKDLANLLHVQGLVLLKQGKYKVSIPYFEKAFKLTNNSNKKIIENYLDALLTSGFKNKAYQIVLDLIKNNQPLISFEELFSRVYTAAHGKNNQYSAIFQSLLKQRYNNLKKNIPAPSFTLLDFSEKEVTSEQNKNKVVVVQFWSTRSNVHRRTMPIMKKIYKHFYNDEDINFVFINTWEHQKNHDPIDFPFDYFEMDETKQQYVARIKEYCGSMNFDVPVLLDSDSQVAKAFNIVDIPMLIIIDKENKISFERIGYCGNPDRMVTEIQTMINMLI